MLYAVKFTLHLWIENEDTADIFDDFCKQEPVLLKSSCAEKRAVAQNSPPSRHLGLGMRLVFSCKFGLLNRHLRQVPGSSGIQLIRAILPCLLSGIARYFTREDPRACVLSAIYFTFTEHRAT